MQDGANTRYVAAHLTQLAIVRKLLRGTLHAQAGDSTAAFRDLARAVQLGWRRGWILRADFSWKAMRDDPRYAALVEQIDADTARLREMVRAAAAG